MSPWKLMFLPFLECLVLVGIHSYLGIHVIKRKVIFVDLALAQIAALGTIVAFLFGLRPHTVESYVFSLLFTFMGAAIFSLTRLRDEKIPHEAVIGLVYALAAAVAILVIDRAPHGAEHIKEVLTGSILWVEWHTVLIAAVVYAAVGAFHYIFRDKFLLISNDPQAAYAKGIKVRLWDFLFYMSFGLVITLSVNTAGVLLVFVFLVVPAIMAISITDRLIHQLLIGWGAGTAVSFVGLVGSYSLDLPSGPTVVAVYGGALLLVALSLYVIRSRHRKKRLLHILLGAVAVAGVSAGFFGLGTALGSEHDHHGDLHAAPDEKPVARITDHEDAKDTPAVQNMDPNKLLAQLAAVDITQRGSILDGLGDPSILEKALGETEDEELVLGLSKRLASLDSAKGKAALLELLESGEIPMFRMEALDSLKEMSGDDFGYQPLEEPTSEVNANALESWRHWLETQK